MPTTADFPLAPTNHPTTTNNTTHKQPVDPLTAPHPFTGPNSFTCVEDVDVKLYQMLSYSRGKLYPQVYLHSRTSSNRPIIHDALWAPDDTNHLDIGRAAF